MREPNIHQSLKCFDVKFTDFLAFQFANQQRHSLIQLYCDDLSETQHKKLVYKWVPDKGKTIVGAKPSAAKVFTADYLPDILEKLHDEEDGAEFEALKAEINEKQRVEFIISRVGWSKSQASHFTPKVIKNLRPPNTVLVWQAVSFCFQAYFPIPAALRRKAEEQASSKAKGARRIKTHWSRSRSYKAKRSQLDALTFVTEWLWKMHKDHGGVSWTNALQCNNCKSV